MMMGLLGNIVAHKRFDARGNLSIKVTSETFISCSKLWELADTTLFC